MQTDPDSTSASRTSVHISTDLVNPSSSAMTYALDSDAPAPALGPPRKSRGTPFNPRAVSLAVTLSDVDVS
jgi:hypothetical protein